MKDIYTPREELVCGKLDLLKGRMITLLRLKNVDKNNIDLLDIIDDIRRDCERMEQKLISRKSEAEELKQETTKTLEAIAHGEEQETIGGITRHSSLTYGQIQQLALKAAADLVQE